MPSKLGQIHDVAETLGRSAGAIASLTVLGAGSRVAPHTHVNPYLALHLLGGYSDCSDGEEVFIAGPAAMFFPAGSAHEMCVGPSGLATVIIEFDASALQATVGGDQLGRPRRWVGGDVGRGASRLARLWLSDAADERRFALTAAFLNSALGAAAARPAPPWLDELAALVPGDGGAPCSEGLARRLGVSRPWLARAYRRWRGEGLGETLRRRRVAMAAILLESADTGLADVAAHAGFCDQSHMNRAFKRLVGRTPAAIRAARLGLSGTKVSAQPSGAG